MGNLQIDEPVSLRELVVAFIDPLYALLREHRELAMALVQARELLPDSDTDADSDDATGTRVSARFWRNLSRSWNWERRRGLRVDRSTTIVVVLGMALGLALLDPVLGVGAVQATPDQVSEAMVELVLHGVSPPDAAPTEVPVDAPVSAQMLLALHERVVAAERRAARAEFALAHASTRSGRCRTAVSPASDGRGPTAH